MTRIQPLNMINKTTIVCIGASLAFAWTSALAAEEKADTSKLPPASTKTGVTYETDIKPIFEKSCVKCHSGEKPKARLRLDTLENALKGSQHGKVIAPGKSADSKLVLSVAHVGDEDDWMPPPNNKAKIPALTAEQVGLIRAWIDQGAK